MLSRFVTAIAVSVFTVAGLASHASAAGIGIPIKIGLIKPGKMFKSVSKPAPATTFPTPPDEDTAGNPIALGGSVTVTANSGTLACTLSAQAYDGTEGWKGLGNPKGSKGWKYLNPSAGGTAGPCKLILMKEKVIKILAKGAGDIPVNDPGSNSEVSIELNAGNTGYCALGVPSIGDPPQHCKEVASTLLKMKDQLAPAACKGCGDNEVNQPGEECDGADASACTCPAACLPPGDENECTCAQGCGNNCVEGGEQCDGTDAEECPGLCLPNCTCPEPVCNNGVKETGEECDPAGSTDDCEAGEVCGGFCECVPDVDCACGDPDPARYMFRNRAPDYVGQICGTTDGTITPTLDCMGLYIGGGGGALPVPNMVPDEATTKWNIDQCVGTDITLAPASPAQVGKRHCSEGKRCAGGTNAGQPCIRDRHCPGSRCEPRCWFGSYLAILNKELPYLSTCISDEIVEDSSGGLDCVSGKAFTRIPIDSVVHLTGSDMSASTPGYQPCPICVGGTLDVPGSGICEGGPDKNKPCTPMGTSYDLYNCCSANSSNATQDCTDDSDCLGAGATCLSGCTEYPTSLDCRPHPLTKVGPGLLLTLQMNTEAPGAYKNTVVADENGVFCGWCRDISGGGSGCFEGNPDTGGAKGCPDSSVINCRPATYNSPPPVGGNLADIAECGDALRCRTDADCSEPYEKCTQRNPGAWRDPAIRTIGYDSAARPGDLRDRLPHPSTSVSNFCIPPNMDEVIDGNSDLGGPGGLSLNGTAKLSPSGAFMDATTGLLD